MPAIDEVIVNGRGDVWIETRRQCWLRVATMSTTAVTTAIEHILRPIGRRIDRSNPTVDARLPDGSRVCAVIEPVAVDGPCLTIRRFALRPLPLSAFATPRCRPAAAAQSSRRDATCWSAERPRRARQRCSMLSPRWCPRRSGSSHSKTSPSCACRIHTSSASRPGRPAPRAPARSPSRNCCAPRCECDPTDWCSARCAERRPCNWCRR